MIGFLYLVLALLFQNPTQQTHGQTPSSAEMSTLDDDTGDTGHVPPKPPTPPTPPPPTGTGG